MKKIYFVIIAVFIAVIFFSHASQALAACKPDQIQFYIVTRDADGVLIPNINFSIFQQLTDPDGHPYFGSSLGTGKTDAGGQAYLCLAASKTGPYAVKFYEYNANYGNLTLWNDSLPPSGTGGYNIEVRLSYMRVVIRDAENELVKNITFDVYVQEYDIDGHAIIGENNLRQEKLVASNYNTGETGLARAYLAAGTYVLRIHGTGPTYFYLWEQAVKNGEVKPLEYKMGTLRVVFADPFNNLLKNQKFSVYKQAYDVRNQPIFGTSIGSFNTGDTGKQDLYLPTGAYAFKINGSQSDAYFTKWKVTSTNDTLSWLNYRLATLRTVIYNNAGALLANQRYSIGEQGTNAAGQPVVTKIVVSSGNTGVLGYQDLYLTPKKYVFIYGEKKAYNIEVFENQVTIINWPTVFSLRPNPGGFMVLTPFANTTLTTRNVASPNVIGIGNIKKNFGNAYQVLAEKINKPYTVVLYYAGKTLPARGISASKLRLAFYNAQTRQWRLVGTNTVSQERVVAVLNAPGTLTLVELK